MLLSTLPPSLRNLLTAVARRIRTLRTIRGVSILLLTLILTGAVALGIDHLSNLPWPARVAVFTVWLTVGVVTAFRALLLPLSRRVEVDAIAAVIEQRNPELCERLSTTVELAESQDPYHGSRKLIRLLARETEAQASQLDSRRSLPARLAAYPAATAVVVGALAVVPFLMWPQRVNELGQRFLLPWYDPPPLGILVKPGDVFAAVGRPLTISAAVQLFTPEVAMPASAALLVTGADGHNERLAMRSDRHGHFTRTLERVAAGFRYRIEAGGIVSGAHEVTAVEPVELAADNPVITITPPEYAKATVDAETVRGTADLAALQHSQLRLELAFNRPAVDARLEWTANGRRNYEAQVMPLALAEDHRSATLDLPALASGSYRLVLQAEHGITTETEPRELTVKVDRPPEFLEVKSPGDSKTVLPYERVPIDLVVADDVGVEDVVLEYRVNEGPVASEPVKLPGRGRLEVRARYEMTLAGKVKDGDELHYRLKAQDNRNVPGVRLTPNIAYHPDASRWLTLRVAAQTEPLGQKEILAKRDALERRLEEIKSDLQREQRQMLRLRHESEDAGELPPDQAEKLKQLREDHRNNEQALRDLAQDAARTPELARLAEQAKAVADQELRRAAEAMNRGGKQPEQPKRDQDFRKAEDELSAALKRLEEMEQLNQKLAQDRLQQKQLELAAERERELAQRAAELAAKDPAKDPAAKQEAEQLKRDQAELAEEVRRQAEMNEDLRQALEAARADDARKLAERARELAKAQQALAEAAQKAPPPIKPEELAELHRKQAELAEKAEKLARETQPTARAARAEPMKSDPARQAAESLKQGDAARAFEQQEQLARDLERLAADLDRAAEAARDPREGARQLARLQEAIQKQLAQETQKKDAPKPLPERLQELRRQQETVKRQAEQLPLPPDNAAAQAARQDAANRAAEATRALERADSKLAAQKMDQARQALERLADQVPSLARRLQEARAEAARLKQQQDEIAQGVEQAAEDARKTPAAKEQLQRKLADAARRQADAAERLGNLDAPGHEARQARVQESLNRALTDLLDNRPGDAVASQQQAKRELDRLAQALAGNKPADEEARDLAAGQQKLAEEAARLAADPKAEPQKQDELRQRQSVLTREVERLQAGEAPVRKGEAIRAAQRAEEAANQKPAGADTVQRMQEAARTLQKLAEQMASKESEATKAERLAKKQAEVADEAERLAKKKPNQLPDEELQRRQRQVAAEAQQLRAGEAQAEKEQALQRLTRAQRAGTAEEQAKAQREAADALDRLTDRLAGRTTPAAQAEDLARRQRELAQQAARPDAAQPPAEASQEAVGEQARMERQLDRLDPKGAEPERKQVAERMAEARRALEQGKAPADAKEQLERAAEAAQQLARKLAGEKPVEQPANKPAEERAPTELARDLARRQTDLARSTERLRNQQPFFPTERQKQEFKKSLDKIGGQQEELNREAAKLKAPESPQALQQARRSMNEAKQALDKTEPWQGQQKQREAASWLEKLAKEMTEQSARKPQQQPADQQQPGKQQGEQARDLAQQQRELREQVKKMVEQAKQDQQQGEGQERESRQQDLQRQASDLLRDLNRLKEQAQRNQEAKQPAQQAAESAQQGEQSMQQAREQAGQGNRGQAQQGREDAVRSLERAAEQAEQTARRLEGERPGGEQAGESVRQAQGQMQQAEKQLDQGQPKDARGAMERAADALMQAAQQLAQRQQPGQPMPSREPGPMGATADGQPDKGPLAPDVAQYAGKRWGELPGELRTRILQDVKARYGDDYARIIKLYFEQIADTKRK